MNKADETVNISSTILCFIGGAAVTVVAFATLYSAVLKTTSDAAAYAWTEAGRATDTSVYTPQHVVVPPVLGDVVAGAQGACGCPGCCSVLNS